VSGVVKIVKMSGAGNDFIVVGPEQRDAVEGERRDWIRRICRRRLSIGADGVLFVRSSGRDRVEVVFHNPDGSVAFCGNGSRCAARFAFANGLAASTMVLETAAGEVAANVEGESVRLRLPAPVDHGTMPLDPLDESVHGHFVRAGVPHFVILDAGLGPDALSRWGPRIRRDPRFGPDGTNFDVVIRTRPDRLDLRTWERGVEGETLSCGSGAVAAAFAARLEGGPATVRVVPASGVPLQVDLPGPPQAPEAAVLTGDARFLFSAVVNEEATRGFPDS
jgi:diaminopimelate epimerase